MRGSSRRSPGKRLLQSPQERDTLFVMHALELLLKAGLIPHIVLGADTEVQPLEQRREETGPDDVVAGLLAEGRNSAARVLREAGVGRLPRSPL